VREQTGPCRDNISLLSWQLSNLSRSGQNHSRSIPESGYGRAG